MYPQRDSEREKAFKAARLSREAERELELKIADGLRVLTRAEFDTLLPEAKLKFHRNGGRVM